MSFTPPKILPTPDEVVDAVQDGAEHVTEVVEEVVDEVVETVTDAGTAASDAANDAAANAPLHADAHDGALRVDIGGTRGVTGTVGMTAEGQVGLDAGLYGEEGGVRQETGLTANLDADADQVGVDAGLYHEGGDKRIEGGVTANLDVGGSSAAGHAAADVGLFGESYDDGQRASRGEVGVHVGGQGLAGDRDDDTTAFAGTAGVGFHTDTSIGDEDAQRYQVDVGVGGGAAVGDNGLEEARGGVGFGVSNTGDSDGDYMRSRGGGGQYLIGGRIANDDGRASVGAGGQASIIYEDEDGGAGAETFHGSVEGRAMVGHDDQVTIAGVGIGVEGGTEAGEVDVFLGAGGGVDLGEGTGTGGGVSSFHETGLDPTDSLGVIGVGIDRDDDRTTAGFSNITSDPHHEDGQQLYDPSDDYDLKTETSGVQVADWELDPNHIADEVGEAASHFDPGLGGSAGDGQASGDIQLGHTDDGRTYGVTGSIGVTAEGQIGVDVGVYSEGDGDDRVEHGATVNLDAEGSLGQDSFQAGGIQGGLDVGIYGEETGEGRREFGATVNVGEAGGGGAQTVGVDAGLFGEHYDDAGNRVSRADLGVTAGIGGGAAHRDDDSYSGGATVGVGFAQDEFFGDEEVSRGQSTMGFGGEVAQDYDRIEEVTYGIGVSGVNVGDSDSEDAEYAGGYSQTTGGVRFRQDDDSTVVGVGASQTNAQFGDDLNEEMVSGDFTVGVNMTNDGDGLDVAVGVDAGGHANDIYGDGSSGGRGFVGVGGESDGDTVSGGLVVNEEDIDTGRSSLDVFGATFDLPDAPEISDAPEGEPTGADDVLGFDRLRLPDVETPTDDAQVPDAPDVDAPALDDAPPDDSGALAIIGDQVDGLVDFVTDLFGGDDDQDDAPTGDDGDDDDAD